jgi:hypothetical protein
VAIIRVRGSLAETGAPTRVAGVRMTDPVAGTGAPTRVAGVRMTDPVAGTGAPTRVAGVRVRDSVTRVSGGIREALPMNGTRNGFARAGRPRRALPCSALLCGLPCSVLLRSDPPCVG